MKDQKLQTLNHSRSVLIKSLIFSALITLLLWLLLYSFFSPVPNMQEPVARLIFAVKCVGMATLFSIVLGVKAVIYERLGTSVISALGDGESLRLKVNQRYVQQTLEQLLIFMPGLLMLALYCETAETMRCVEVATFIWIGSRLFYWLNYHQDIQNRVPGMIGMLQNSLILLYGSARFSYELGGIFGAVVTVGIFIGLEIYLLGINKL